MTPRVRPRGRSRAARGFTLVEILLAVTLLSLLMALAYGSIRTATRSAHSGEAMIERTSTVRGVQEFLRRQISHAMPLLIERMEDAGDNRILHASADELVFAAPMPGYLARGGPHVQFLRLVRGDDGLQLEFDHTLLNGYDPTAGRSQEARPPVVLLSGIADGGFEYRALDEDGVLTDWFSEWDDPMRLPLMVRLHLEWPEQARMRWPTLDIPIVQASAVPGIGLQSPMMDAPARGRGGARRPPRIER